MVTVSTTDSSTRHGCTYIVVYPAFLLNHAEPHVEAVEEYRANPKGGLRQAKQNTSLVDKVDAL